MNAGMIGEGLHGHGHAREPNETTIMKARPLTSTRLASKSHFGSNSQQFGQTAGSQTIKYSQGARQVFINNKTLEANASSMHQNPCMLQMKSQLGRMGHQNETADSHH